MRKRDPFQSQDQRHNRKKEKRRIERQILTNRIEEIYRYESSDSGYEIQLAVLVKRRTSMEDSREPTVREEATQPERVSLHPSCGE